MANNIKFNLLLNANKTLNTFKSLQRQVDVTNRGVNTLNKSLGRQIQINKKVANSAKGSAKGMSNISKAASSARGAIFATIGVMTAFAAAGTAVAFGALKTASEFEKLSTQFEVLTGSAEKAKDLFQDLTEFSKSTPFQIKDIAGASKTLLAFGLSADEVKTRIRSLGDISAVSGKPLNDLARIFGQIRAQGKLTAERLNQLNEAGITLGPSISESMGIAESDFRKFVSQGKVGADEVEKAFNKMTSAGGRFFQGTQKLSETAAGKFSTLKDNITGVSNSIGQALLPVTKVFLDIANRVVRSMADWVSKNVTAAKVLQVLTFATETLRSSLLFLNKVWAGAKAVIVGVQTAYQSFVLLIVKAVGPAIRKLAGGLSFLAGKLGFSTKGFDNFNNTLKDLENIKFETILDNGADGLNKVGKEAEQTAKKINSSINSINSKLVEATAKGPTIPSSDSSSPKASTGPSLVNQAEKKRLAELKKLRDEARLAEVEAQIQQDIFETGMVEGRLAKLQEQLGIEEAIKFEARLRNNESLETDEMFKLEKQKLAFERRKELYKTEEQLRIEGEANVAKIIEEIQQDSADRKAKINKQVVQDTGSMFGNLAKLSALGGKKMFKITKALNLAQATTTGALAIQQAAAALPFPANIPGIVSMTALSAANIAKIISEKPPAFQEGGIVPNSSFSGDQNLVRANSGEMILNRMQQTKLFNEINNGGSGPSNQTVVVEIDGEAVAKAVSRQVDNGLSLGDNI